MKLFTKMEIIILQALETLHTQAEFYILLIRLVLIQLLQIPHYTFIQLLVEIIFLMLKEHRALYLE